MGAGVEERLHHLNGPFYSFRPIRTQFASAHIRQSSWFRLRPPWTSRNPRDPHALFVHPLKAEALAPCVSVGGPNSAYLRLNRSYKKGVFMAERKMSKRTKPKAQSSKSRSGKSASRRAPTHNSGDFIRQEFEMSNQRSGSRNHPRPRPEEVTPPRRKSVRRARSVLTALKREPRKAVARLALGSLARKVAKKAISVVKPKKLRRS